MQRKDKGYRNFITGRQADHLAMWVDFSLARLFFTKESVQKIMEKKLLQIYYNLKFYLKDRSLL